MVFHTVEQHIFECRKNKQKDPTFFYSIGGIEEIGKNCYCVEHLDEIVIMDFGIKFGNKLTQPGVTGEIPNLDYLIENQKKIFGLLITHGHEDHIGGVPHLVNSLDIPVIYAPALAMELIKKKLEENKIERLPKLEVYDPDTIIFTKHFAFDVFPVNHSIPDSFGFAISTPNGVVVFSGDFRFDLKNKIDSKAFQRLISIGGRQVDLLLCESTAAAQPGFNESEATIIQELKNIISSSEGRIIITFFASNLGRIEEIVKLASSAGRKIIVFGRSIESSLKCSQAVGILNSNELKNVFIPSSEINTVPDKKILIICTGSQGEESSALNNISKGLHPIIQLKPSDDIIFSSNVIPGNKQAVNELVNRLYKSGCRLFLNSNECKIHASGHATKLEQQLFISLIAPSFLAPVHGEKKMLHDLKRNISELKIVPSENIFILKNGEKLKIFNRKVTKAEPEEHLQFKFPYYVMENKLTDHGRETLGARTKLATNGLLTVSMTVDLSTKKLFSISPVTTIGSLSFSLSAEILRDLGRMISKNTEELFNNSKGGLSKEDIISSNSKIITDFFNKKGHKIPQILILLEETNSNELWENSISANTYSKPAPAGTQSSEQQSNSSTTN
ncbi:ribonuclease J [Mycoplasma suis]|uniref:Metallo-beta-lactamase superfamily protein n=2 Tax=Mycoplasma suis TaxID=57372 RepID=F0QR98_MYCSL|nr:ribonuclease J [Mycoplasma suis]ADX98018.1 metallo-beta-lactamase superfamily protein [Mycoplasma suis str. Illinois]CBZ40514.1 Metallo-beta-lactamase superfamily protein [Mycoplasma suis KI3806]